MTDTLLKLTGKNKAARQIASIPDGYVVSDSLEYGHGKKLPLWIFGFLYQATKNILNAKKFVYWHCKNSNL